MRTQANYRTQRKQTVHLPAEPAKTPWYQQFKISWRYLDYWLLGMVAVLILVGLVMTYSSTMYMPGAAGQGSSAWSFLRTQALATVLGWLGFLVVVMIPFRWLTDLKLINIANIIWAGVLFVTLIFGVAGGGARSWLDLGVFSVQPSEFMKLLAILTVSWYMNYTHREAVFSNGQQLTDMAKLLTFGVPALSIVIIFLQNDIGMNLIIIATSVLLSFVGRRPKKVNLWLYAGAVGGFFLLHGLSRWFSDWFVSQQTHIFERVGSFTDPFKYPEESGFQLISAYQAFSRGGWFGQGLGHGVTKAGGLPAGHTDYILAVIGEELGLIGVTLVVGCLYAVIIRLFYWAAQMTSSERRYIVLGVGILMMVQTTINLGGVLGLIPLTGVTLPFVSYGGTSMIVSILAIGLATNCIVEERQHQQGAKIIHLNQIYE